MIIATVAVVYLSGSAMFLPYIACEEDCINLLTLLHLIASIWMNYSLFYTSTAIRLHTDEQRHLTATSRRGSSAGWPCDLVAPWGSKVGLELCPTDCASPGDCSNALHSLLLRSLESKSMFDLDLDLWPCYFRVPRDAVGVWETVLRPTNRSTDRLIADWRIRTESFSYWLCSARFRHYD